MRSIEWWHFQWPWRTPNPVFKVTAFRPFSIRSAPFSAPLTCSGRAAWSVETAESRDACCAFLHFSMFYSAPVDTRNVSTRCTRAHVSFAMTVRHHESLWCVFVWRSWTETSVVFYGVWSQNRAGAGFAFRPRSPGRPIIIPGAFVFSPRPVVKTIVVTTGADVVVS